MGVLPRQRRVEPLHRLSGVADGWRGPLQLTPCCDKQQMFSNNVYRPGLHLQMTHTCFQSNRPREAIHPQSSGWPLHRRIHTPHITPGASADSSAANNELAC